MNYHEMALEAADFATRRENGRQIGRFTLRVLHSPAGEMAPADAVEVEFDDRQLQASLLPLERRDIEQTALIAVGRSLAALLLPVAGRGTTPSAREFFARSLEMIAADEGLRLRLRLPSELAVLPWEYLYVERAGGEGLDGFLALDPRIAIVRHEVLPIAAASPQLDGDIRLLLALAQAEDLPELDLAGERTALQTALRGIEGIAVEICEDATLDNLQSLLPSTAVFHFAGHGDFTRQMGARPGTYSGAGYLALTDQRVAAEQMAINLHGNGVRLAVLAACRTGRRDGVSVWSGIAPALVNVGIPAVVANQYAIRDVCAIAFCRQFYQALAGGLPLERALSAGRIAAYNADPQGFDWGVPVLYLRADSGRLFTGAADAGARRRAQQAAEADIDLRAAAVATGGVLVGVDLRRMLDGRLSVNVTVAGEVTGTVVGGRVKNFEGGQAKVQVDVGTVGAGGRVTGFRADTFGRAAARKPPRARGTSRAMPELPAAAAPADDEPDARRSFGQTQVDVDSVSGGQVIGTQYQHRETVHGPQTHIDAGAQATLNTGISATNLQIGSVIIQQGTGGVPAPDAPLIEEKLRLDAALPRTATVGEAFDLVIAVRQPDAPPLSIADLEQVVSAEGSVFRREDSDLVKYRIEVSGATFTVEPRSYIVKLRPRRNSPPVTFQVTGSKAGKHSLLVSAYQEDDSLAAQTRLSIELHVAVQEG